MNDQNNQNNHSDVIIRWPQRHPPRPELLCLRFAPLAWLKLQYFCHAGGTEVGGFAVSSAADLLHVERFETVLQGATAVGVELADGAVADFFDACVDGGLQVQQFGRIWCHTHPGDSPEPSVTDERTFERVFGACDWAVMFILSRTGRTYARLSFSAGPGGSLLLPVMVDWSHWPRQVAAGDMVPLVQQWQQEYQSHVHALEPARWGGGGGVMDLEGLEELHGSTWAQEREYEALLEACERRLEERS